MKLFQLQEAFLGESILGLEGLSHQLPFSRLLISPLRDSSAGRTGNRQTTNFRRSGIFTFQNPPRGAPS